MARLYRSQLTLAATTCAIGFFAFFCCAQQPHKPSPAEQATIKDFLRGHLKDPGTPNDPTTRFTAVLVDLNGDGKPEVVVYLVGRDWCGSGGCPLLILEARGASYRVVTQTTVTWPPIRVLQSKTNGWHDLGVTVSGGGILHGYEVKLIFNGHSYPTNPSSIEEERRKLHGQVLIPEDEGETQLY